MADRPQGAPSEGAEPPEHAPPPPPPVGIPPSPLPPGPPLPGTAQPHRGVLILVLGIVGLVSCPICGIVAWVLANADLEAMRAGSMDPSGEGMTSAGRICGIISVALLVVHVLMVPLLMLSWYLIYG